MSNQSDVESARAYRLDKFIVPHAAREEFLPRIHSIHALLKTQPGFNPQQAMDQLGITMEMGNYKSLPTSLC